MNASGWLQLFLYLVVLLAVTKPIGLYLHAVLDPNGKTILDPVIKPIERLTYWLGGIDPKKEQDWRRYAGSLLVFSVLTMLFTYAILRLQDKLPLQALLNPQKMPAVSPDLAFNTVLDGFVLLGIGDDAAGCSRTESCSNYSSILRFCTTAVRHQCGNSGAI